VAAQKDTQGDSLVTFAVKAITKTDNNYFCQWVESRLDGNGHKTHAFTPDGDAPGGNACASAWSFCSRIGEGSGPWPAALGPLKPSTGHQGGANETDSKQLYGEEDIAALMSFSHIKRGADLQDMWTYFQTSKRKTWTCAADSSWRA
jgi:hypothetical protein